MNRTVVSFLALVFGIGMSASAAVAEEAEGFEDRGDRVEERLDHRGDRIEDRLDRRGDRIDRRLDRRGNRIDRRLDRRGSRFDRHSDRRWRGGHAGQRGGGPTNFRNSRGHGQCRRRA